MNESIVDNGISGTAPFGDDSDKVNHTLNGYQDYALSTAVCTHDNEIRFLAIGLCEESGEVAGKIKKAFRDHDGILDECAKREIAFELGDVLWYLSNLSNAIGFSLSDIARMNIDKINDRFNRGKIHGQGDKR